jgi:S1-C subfamily serine protease
MKYRSYLAYFAISSAFVFLASVLGGCSLPTSNSKKDTWGDERSQSSSDRSAHTGIVAQVDEIARQITVRINSSKNGNGSGVIFAKQGNTYSVLTASHVVSNPDKYKIVTPDFGL